MAPSVLGFAPEVTTCGCSAASRNWLATLHFIDSQPREESRNFLRAHIRAHFSDAATRSQ